VDVDDGFFLFSLLHLKREQTYGYDPSGEGELLLTHFGYFIFGVHFQQAIGL